MTNPWRQIADDKILEDKVLLDVVAKIAIRELREDESTRKQCLYQFREWITKNNDIENCLLDNCFLLRFLRTKKFSLPMAQQTLLKYLNLRKRFPLIFYNMDCLADKAEQLVNAGYTFVSPVRDKCGRRVIFTIPRNCDPSKFTSSDMARAHIMAFETLLDEEENQIMGFSYVADAQGIGAGHIAMWSITEFATLLKWGEQSCPIRHKIMHMINLSPAMKYVVDFARSRVSDKLKERLKIHSNSSEMLQDLDKDVLPKEYGGIMPMAQMIDMWKKEMVAKRERLLSFDKMQLLSDRGIIRRNNNDLNMENVQGSFRKLDID